MTDRPRNASPTLRAALAAFAVLLNILAPGGWALAAAPADPLAGGVILCLAGGGTAIVPAAPDPSRAPSPENRGHCPVCPVPTASIPPSPSGNGFVHFIQHVRIKAFRADTPLPTGLRYPATEYPRGPPA
tara:strand:- start:157 stop:546 length:390 start_codon:yes stop_codon:yes gene_type:complete